MHRAIHTSKGAQPKGPYSQAIVASGPLVFVSGQGAIDPDTGEIRIGGFQEQAKQVFKNVSVLLDEAGSSWENAIKVTVYLSELDNFNAMNEVYRQFVSEPYPARTTVQANLGNNSIVVDCIAVIPQMEEWTL